VFKVYSTTTCAYCQMVKKFLALKGKEYEEINLDEKPELREHAFSMSNGMTSVPVVTKVENGEEKLVVVGWNPSLMMKAL
jgi:glutaredoxin 3